MRHIALALMIPLLLVACSKEEKKAEPAPTPAPMAAPPPVAAPPATRPEDVNPCAFFTKEDAEALLGGPVDPPVAQNHSAGAILSCSYAEAQKPEAKAAAKKSKQKERLRQPGVDPTVPVLSFTAQAAKRTHTNGAAEAIQRMQTIGAAITPEATEVAGGPATWLKGPDMLFADRNGWIVNTSTTKKGDRQALSRGLMERILPRLPPAPE
jgi:hypothetical protein